MVTTATPEQTLAKAFQNAAIELGIDPNELGTPSLGLVQVYLGVRSLVGGRPDDIRHWMHTPNLGTGGIPAEQVCTKEGLARVLGYVDKCKAHN